MDLDLIRSLAVAGTTKMVLLSADGLGGFPDPATGLSELETARIPHLDALARRGSCGLLRHVAPGITPGSGPGHLGLFGYEPLRYPVGRGVLDALGIDFDLRPGDVAARGNFCTLDAEKTSPFCFSARGNHEPAVLPLAMVTAVRRSHTRAVGMTQSRLISVGSLPPETGDPAGDHEAAEPAPDTAPETVADLAELGTKLPGTGNRADRGDQDTDEDLF